MCRKIYLFSFCVYSMTFACLRAEACPFALPNITNGVNAELIHNDNELLLGIRVSWSWLSSVSVDCFQSPVVELSLSTGHSANSTSVACGSRNNSVDFFNLYCNQMYTPRVKATYGNFQSSDTGNTVFFGGSERSPPSVLPRVCVGPYKFRSRVNISWKLLPCHLQNGADITSYTILYTPMSTGVTTRLPTSSRHMECSQEFGVLYSCILANSLIPNYQAFSIQVAAQNKYGEAPFSDNIIILSAPVSINSTICTSPSDTMTADTQTTTTSFITSEDADHSLKTSTVAYSQTEASSNTTTTMAALIKSTKSSQEGTVWTLMGSLVAVIAVTAGIVIVVQFIINYTLWKRLRSLKNKAIQQKSTLCEKIDMKECSAYGQVISPQPVTEQSHIYEATT